MQAKTVKSVPYEIGDRKREFRLDLNAMELIEELTGHNPINEPEAFVPITAKHLKILLWGSLSSWCENTPDHEPALDDPEKGVKLVGSWITPSNYFEAVQVMTKCFQDAYPEPEPEKESGEEETQPKNSSRRGTRSSNSGQSAAATSDLVPASSGA